MSGIVLGNELWKTTGTLAGTSLVKDINPNAGNSNPYLTLVSNGKIIFSATDGDNQFLTDLFVVDGTFTPLPLHLLDFNASVFDKSVRLNWATASEINSSHFEIERSKDGSQFNNIGRVNAINNSQRTPYNFTDAEAMNAGVDKLFYRLKVVDKDGKFSYSKVVTVNLKKGSELLYAYPNPVNGEISITLNTQTSQKAILKITDVSGKECYSSQINIVQGANQYPINVSSFAKGLYYIRLITDEKVLSVKFVKN